MRQRWFYFLFLIFAAAGLLPAQSASSANSSDIFSLLQEAGKDTAAGDLNRAELALNVVLVSSPNDCRALNLLGIVRAQQHQEAEAEKLFRKAIAAKPGFASAHVSLGMLDVQMSRRDEAIIEFQEALRLDSQRDDARSALVNVWREQARAAIQANDPEKALALLINARKEHPNDPDVLYDFGMVALRMSLLPDATEAFEKVLSTRPDDTKALYGLGRAQMSMADFEPAQKTFTTYLASHPDDASAHYALGTILESLQKPDQARAEFEKSIALQPTQTESYFHLGRIDIDSGDLDAAQKLFDHVLQRDPRHAGALAGMGRVAFQKKNYEKAVDWLTQAANINTSLREAHYYLGLAYARMDRKDESEEELAIASELEHSEVKQHQNPARVVPPQPAPGAAADPPK